MMNSQWLWDIWEDCVQTMNEFLPFGSATTQSTDIRQAAIRNEQAWAIFDANKSLLSKQKSSGASPDAFSTLFHWANEINPPLPASDVDVTLDTFRHGIDTENFRRRFQQDPSGLSRIAAGIEASILAQESTELPAAEDHSQHMDSPEMDVLKDLESQALEPTFYEEIHKALLDRASCCSNGERYHIALIQMQHEQSTISDQSHLDIFCGRSDDPDTWHVLRRYFDSGQRIQLDFGSTADTNSTSLCTLWSETCIRPGDCQFVHLHDKDEPLRATGAQMHPTLSTPRSPAPRISLARILGEPINQGLPELFLSQREKAELRLALAIALYQIPPRTWLPEEWNSEKILFRCESTPLVTPKITLDDPFISTPLVFREERRGDSQRLASIATSFLSFALVLLEIECGRRLPLSMSRSVVKYTLTVCREVQRMKGFTSPSLMKAVDACVKLRQVPELKGKHATYDEMRRRILHDVVKPLITDMLGYQEPPVDRRIPEHEQPSLDKHSKAKRNLSHFDHGDLEIGFNNQIDELVSANSGRSTKRGPKVTFADTSIEYGDASSVHLWLGNDRFLQLVNRDDSQDAQMFFTKMENFFSELRRHEASPGHMRRVRVAIIDSGFGPVSLPGKKPDPIIRGAGSRIIAKKSWVGAADSDCCDECGHGTHVAKQLLKVAPHAELVIAKVSKTMRIPKRNLHYIAEAITWAAEEQDADIISLSLGLDEKDQSLDAAIDKFLNLDGSQGPKYGIVFAAASNDGAHRERTNPASRRGVIGIHATDGLGAPASFNPPPDYRNEFEERENFSVLGVNIPSKFSTDEEVYISGTSFATPIAAGIAANLLEFAFINVEMDSDERNALQSYFGVQRLLMKLSKITREYDFICPWRHTNSVPNRDARWLCILLQEVVSVAKRRIKKERVVNGSQ